MYLFEALMQAAGSGTDPLRFLREWWPVVSPVVFAVAGGLGWVLKQRQDRMQERITRSTATANNAQTTANTAKTDIDTQVARFDLYDRQLNAALDRVASLETAVDGERKFRQQIQERFRELQKQYDELNHKYDELEVRALQQGETIIALSEQNKQQHVRITELETWQEQANVHMDETTEAIRLLPDGVRPVIKTKRPNGEHRDAARDRTLGKAVDDFNAAPPARGRGDGEGEGEKGR